MKWTMRVAVAAMLVGLSATVLLSAANGGKLKIVTPGMILELMGAVKTRLICDQERVFRLDNGLDRPIPKGNMPLRD